MRRIGLRLTAVALVAATCTTGSDDVAVTTTTTSTSPPLTTTTMAPQLKPVGGTVRILSPGEPTLVLRPVFSEAGWADVLPGNVLNGVWRFDGETGELVPDLIVELPSTSSGGLIENDDGTLTVRYEIHPDAVWSDGTPVTGRDFEFTQNFAVAAVQRADPDSGRFIDGGPIVTLCGVDRELTASRGPVAHLAVVPDSVIVGEKTFEYTITEPADYSEDLFRYVLPRHAVEGTDFLTDFVDELYPSAGPFLLESFDRDAQLITLVRNENYWRTNPETGQQLPYLDRVVAGWLPEVADAIPDTYTFDHDNDPQTAPVTVEGVREFNDLRTRCGEERAAELLGLAENDHHAEEGAHHDDGEPGRLDLLRQASLQAQIETENALISEGVLADLFIADAAHIADLDDPNVEVTTVAAGTWEHLTFHYGDARFRVNPDSLVDHLDFRLAVAHALDRDRIAREAPEAPGVRVDSIIEAFSPTLSVPGGLPYSYDPDRARELLDELCGRLDRDCTVDPPSLVFTYPPAPSSRARLATLVAEMLGDVGIDVDIRAQALFDMVSLEGCGGWESSTWAWDWSVGLTPFVPAYNVLDPNGVPHLHGGNWNPYAWGTGAVSGLGDDPDTAEIDGLVDDPATPDCNEATQFDQGQSPVRNEFTERFADVYAELLTTVDRDAQLRRVNELETIIAEQVAVIPLYLRPVGYAVRTDILGGAGFSKMFNVPARAWNLELWYLKRPQEGA